MTPGADAHAARQRFAETVAFTGAHALDAGSWPATDWAVAHPAAMAWQAAKAGEPVTVLSLRPEAYEGTGDYPLWSSSAGPPTARRLVLVSRGMSANPLSPGPSSQVEVEEGLLDELGERRVDPVRGSGEGGRVDAQGHRRTGP